MCTPSNILKTKLFPIAFFLDAISSAIPVQCYCFAVAIVCLYFVGLFPIATFFVILLI